MGVPVALVLAHEREEVDHGARRNVAEVDQATAVEVGLARGGGGPEEAELAALGAELDDQLGELTGG
ncbi:hypothetical protein ATKI12_2791 [Kitasatospora sp. Ki12]